MSPTRPAPLPVALLLLATALTARSAEAAAPSPGKFLPPDQVLARVGPRPPITAASFSRAYFDSDPTGRPKPDSTGRVVFLGTLVKRDVMALAAHEINPPLDFTQRAELRTFTNSVLRNVLFQRMVLDSVTVSDEELHKAYDQYKEDVRLEHILILQRQAAERVRNELIAKKISWNDAVQLYSMADDRARNGDMGWRSRFAADEGFAQAIFTLKVGEISPVFSDANGYHIARVAERRPGKPPAFEPVRETIDAQIRNRKAAMRTRMIQEQLLKEYDVHYDAENLRWGAQQFVRPINVERVNGSPVVNIDQTVPELPSADTARVLARYAGGQVTLGRIVQAYSDIDAMLRPPLDTPDLLQGYVDVIILEPRMIQMARERGLEKDPAVIQAVEYRQEGMLIERIYADSIVAQVRVDDAKRRKYYKEHLPDFITYPRVKFAAFSRGTKESADSLKSQLLAGLKAEDLIRQDSLAGLRRGSLQERSANDHGYYHTILFEELRPGQVSIQGPDKQGHFVVLQLLTYDPGKQLAYEDVVSLVDDIVRHAEEERLFEAFVDRYRKRYKIETHPELVMGVELQTT